MIVIQLCIQLSCPRALYVATSLLAFRPRKALASTYVCFLFSGGLLPLTTPSVTPLPPFPSVASTQEQVTTTGQSSCFHNISVVFPVSSFCSSRADGPYLRTDGTVVLYRCIHGKLFVTRCHAVGSEHSGAASITLPVGRVLSTIFLMMSVV